MEQWVVAFLIFAAITVGMVAQAWVSLLEHNRRKQAMDVIKTAIEHGKEAPREVYDMLETKTGVTGQPPWAEVVIFTALGIGFLVGFATADEPDTAFLAVGIAMIVTALGCLILAIFRPGRRRRDGGE